MKKLLWQRINWKTISKKDIEILFSSNFDINQTVPEEDLGIYVNPLFYAIDAGNFQAIRLAQDAGFDFIFVGYLERLQHHTKLSLLGKLIDVQNGITIWYGKSELGEIKYKTHQGDIWGWFGERRLDEIDLNANLQKITKCLVNDALSNEPKP